MQKLIAVLVVITMLGLVKTVEGEDNLSLMIRDANVRNNIVLAIENARLLRQQLTTADALVENEGFINAASNCLQKDTSDYCYFAIREIIEANDYYSGQKVIHTK